MAEAVQSDPFAYRSFNDVLHARAQGRRATGRRRPDAHRQPGRRHGQSVRRARWTTDVLQAKGHHYSLEELLGGDHETRRRLSRRQLRLHLPRALQLSSHPHAVRRRRVRSNLYVPGDLFSVNASTARAVPRVFARNERLICDFDTAHGRMARDSRRRLVRRQHRDRSLRRSQSAAARAQSAACRFHAASAESSRRPKSSVASTWARRSCCCFRRTDPHGCDRSSRSDSAAGTRDRARAMNDWRPTASIATLEAAGVDAARRARVLRRNACAGSRDADAQRGGGDRRASRKRRGHGRRLAPLSAHLA